MIWSTWRQHRTTIVAAVGGILVLAVVALVCGWIMRGSEGRRAFGTSLGCAPGVGSTQCWAESSLTAISTLAAVLPVVLGVFVGVTVFSRDIERGTHVLGLSQSTSRVQWYWSRVLVVYVPIAVAGVVLGSVLEWTRSVSMASPYLGYVSNSLGGHSRMAFPLFQSTGIVLGAYTVLALVLGSCIALLLRNTLASMVVTLIAMTALIVGFQIEARPQYATPAVEAQPLGTPGRVVSYMSDSDGVWVLSSGFVDADGRNVNFDYALCDYVWADAGWNQRPDETLADYEARQDAIYAAQDRAYADCQRAQGVDHFESTYHPDSLFRRFQLIEVALVLALSALLVIPSLWALRRLRP